MRKQIKQKTTKEELWCALIAYFLTDAEKVLETAVGVYLVRVKVMVRVTGCIYSSSFTDTGPVLYEKCYSNENTPKK